MRRVRVSIVPGHTEALNASIVGGAQGQAYDPHIHCSWCGRPSPSASDKLVLWGRGVLPGAAAAASRFGAGLRYRYYIYIYVHKLCALLGCVLSYDLCVLASPPAGYIPLCPAHRPPRDHQNIWLDTHPRRWAARAAHSARPLSNSPAAIDSRAHRSPALLSICSLGLWASWPSVVWFNASRCRWRVRVSARGNKSEREPLDMTDRRKLES